MTKQPDHDPIQRVLEQRVSAIHLRQRQGIEDDHDQRIFGQGLGMFHIENWYSIHAVIRGILRLTLLHRRGQRNALDPRIVHNRISVPALAERFEGFTILQISDLHLDMNDGIPHVLAEVIRQVDYDLCVLTGDFRAKTYGPYDAALEAMNRVRIHIKSPVFGVLGNHDTIKMVPGLESMGIQMLLNESAPIERDGARIHLAGVDDAHYFCAHNLEKAARDIPQGEVSVLLSHSPEIYRPAAHVGFDVMLSGHTHGGQVCLPGGFPLLCNARCGRAYCAGPWRYYDLQGYTSRGSGVSVVDVRFNCPPEITLHHLHGV